MNNVQSRRSVNAAVGRSWGMGDQANGRPANAKPKSPKRHRRRETRLLDRSRRRRLPVRTALGVWGGPAISSWSARWPFLRSARKIRRQPPTPPPILGLRPKRRHGKRRASAPKSRRRNDPMPSPQRLVSHNASPPASSLSGGLVAPLCAAVTTRPKSPAADDPASAGRARPFDRRRALSGLRIP